MSHFRDRATDDGGTVVTQPSSEPSTAGYSALARRAVRGSIWAATGSYAGFLLSFGGVAILARYLSPMEFGLYALVQSYSQILATLGAIVPGQVVVQSDSTWKSIADTALRLTAALRLALLVIAIPLSFLLFHFYDRTSGVLFFLMSVLQLLDGVRSAMGSVLERDFRYRSFTFISTLGFLLAVVTSGVMAQLGGGVYSLLVRDAVPVITTLVTFMMLSRRWGLPTGASWNRESARRILSFGRGLFWIRALDQLSGRLDRIILGNLLSVNTLGYYSQARYLANLPVVVLAPGNQMVAANTYSKIRDDKGRLNRAFSTVQYFVVRIVPLMGLGFALWPKEILVVLFGVRWIPAAGALRVLSIYVVLSPALESYRALMTALEEWKVLRSAAALQLLVLVIGMAVLSPRFGIDGASLAAALAIVTSLLYLVLAARRRLLRRIGRDVWFVLIATAIGALAGIGATSLVPTSNILRLVVGFSTAAICYAASLVVLERRAMVERFNMVRHLARSPR